ncbi:MAG: VWA domain-containing protein [Betaproteobacteria bacterium]|jgi:Ca-activated chloride channel family protein|nr:VWA domain-containing protein [Betaproteobacteria bacterium]MCC7396734.1 VWA domain-containing protein [Planctomycetota bacterium]
MRFLWSSNLWWMLALPGLPAFYLWLLRRGVKPALRLPSLNVARAAAGRRWRRHVPPALVFGALSLLALAFARPTVSMTLPWAKTTILLAVDISHSMAVADVQPTRMAAAQEAAKVFLDGVPRHIEVGLVTFADSAQVAQQATLDRAAVAGAIDAIQMQFGTAIGNGIVLSLAELFPEHGIDVTELSLGTSTEARSLDERAKPRPKQIEPVPAGSYDAAAIILLTDGRRTTGIDTIEAAKMAADRGVRIHVVGLGTPDGHRTMGDDTALYMQLDEPTLRQVATMTGGEYFRAVTAESLRSVYRDLGSQLEVVRRETELTAPMALAAAVLLLAGAALSVWWFGRVA